MYNFFQTDLSDRIIINFKSRQNSTFSPIKKWCLTDLRVVLSKSFFLSTFQILKLLGGVVRLDFEKNTPDRSILYPTPYYLNTLLGHPIIHIWRATDAMF